MATFHIGTFGRRDQIKQRPAPGDSTVSPQTTALGQGYAEARTKGGGIQPGAHPEFETPMAFGNPVTQIRSLVRKIMTYNPYAPKKAK